MNKKNKKKKRINFSLAQNLIKTEEKKVKNDKKRKRSKKYCHGNRGVRAQQKKT